MSNDKYNFLAVIANVDNTIKLVDPIAGCKAERWSSRRLIQTLCDLEMLPSHEIEFILESANCISDDYRYGYVLTNTLRIPDRIEKQKVDPLYTVRIMEDYIARIEGVIKLMRLFRHGNVAIQRYHLYRKHEGQITPDYGQTSDIRLPHEIFTLLPEEARELNYFIQTTQLPLGPAYLQLAFDNFNESYDLYQENLAFLNLMIAVEVLFNVGPQDLRYRICRGIAVLIGENRKDAEDVFSQMKKLYDKRSLLVHTGEAKNLNSNDIVQLKSYLRRALKKLIVLKASKEDLSNRLTAAGFGHAP